MTNHSLSSADVRRAFREELGPGQRPALISWLAFTGTFAGLRAVTYSIRDGKGPFRNISVGGEHLHRYMWGIALLLDLKDVYWAKQGRISTDLGVGGIALAGSYFAALPVLRRLRRELRG